MQVLMSDGGGSKVYVRSDYSKASQNCDTSLTKLERAVKEVANQIENYNIGAEDKLSSETFIIMRRRLNMYAQAFRYLGNAINIAINNIYSGNNSVLNAFGLSGNKISSAHILELEAQIRNANNIINNINAKSKKILLWEVGISKQDETELSRNENLISYIESEKRRFTSILNAVSAADEKAAESLRELDDKLNTLNSAIECQQPLY